MAWLEIHQSLTTHRKTMYLAAILGIPRAHATGLMVTFWLWALDNAPSGDLDCLPPELIEMAAQWEGERGVLLDAMITVGFVVRDNVGMRIHDWGDYAGKLIARREKALDRMRKARDEHNKIKMSTNDARTIREQNANDTRNDRERSVLQYSTVQYSTEPNTYVDKGSSVVGITVNNKDSLVENAVFDSRANGEKPLKVPYKAIMNLWNETLGKQGRPSIRDMTDSRKNALRRLWRDMGEVGDFRDEAAWEQLFKFCGKSEFLLSGGWFTFDWLLKLPNFQKVIEGNYHNNGKGRAK